MRTFEKELETIYRDVYYFVMSRVHDEHAAADITQSVMESVCVKISTLRKRESFKAWVMQITRNKINEYYRMMDRFHEKYDYVASEHIEEEGCPEADIEDIKSDILQKLIHDEDMINIMVALDRLESKYQDVIRLNIICEYNLIETAQLLGQNVSTVRTWSARGLVKLKEEFEKVEAGGKS